MKVNFKYKSWSSSSISFINGYLKFDRRKSYGKRKTVV